MNAMRVYVFRLGLGVEQTSALLTRQEARKRMIELAKEYRYVTVYESGATRHKRVAMATDKRVVSDNI